MDSVSSDITNYEYYFKFIGDQVDKKRLSMQLTDTINKLSKQFNIQTLLSELDIEPNMLENRFFWDIIKDANAGKNKINNIEKVLKDCFPQSSIQTGWQTGLHDLDTKIFDFVENIGEIDNVYIHVKSSTDGQSNMKLSYANYVFYESGMGSDKLVHNNPDKIGSSAATLDPASKQEINKLFNYNLEFDSTFTSNLGFPPDIRWDTKDLSSATNSAPTPETQCSSQVNINFGKDLLVDGIVQNKCGTANTSSLTPSQQQGNFAELCLGNNEKNKKINKNPSDSNNTKKLLVMKELGDIAQIWVYLAFVTILENVGIPKLTYSQGESLKKARTDSVMLTTDNPVFLFCIMLKLACINSGSRQGVTSGGCRLKHYYPGEPNFKKKYEAVLNIYFESTIQYNDNIKNLILRIISNNSTQRNTVDVYLIDNDDKVVTKCVPGARMASRNIEGNKLFDFITNYNKTIFQNNETLKSIYKYFTWNSSFEDKLTKMQLPKKYMSQEFKLQQWIKKKGIILSEDEHSIIKELSKGIGIYNYICIKLKLEDDVKKFNEDGFINDKISDNDEKKKLKENIQNEINKINDLYNKITISFKTEKCIMQHKKITGENSEIMRTIVLPSQFLKDLNEITKMTSIRNIKEIAELNKIIKAAELNEINYEDQDKPIEDQTQVTLNIDEDTQPTSVMKMDGGTNIIGKTSNPDGYQPYYTSLLLTYTDYQIKNDLNKQKPSIFPFEGLQEMSLETIAMRMCGEYCGRMMMDGKLIHTTEEQKKLYFERLQNLQLIFALKYEKNTEMINFQKPGFEKLLVGAMEMKAEEGTVNDVEMVDLDDINNFYKVENSLKSLKNFAYVNDDIFIFNEGKRLAQYIAFAGETELINIVGKKRGADETDATSTITSRPIKSFRRQATRASGGRKTKKKLIRNNKKTKKRLKIKLLRQKQKKSLKERNLLKQKKSLKVRKLNKLKKTIKNKSKY